MLRYRAQSDTETTSLPKESIVPAALVHTEQLHRRSWWVAGGTNLLEKFDAYPVQNTVPRRESETCPRADATDFESFAAPLK